MKLGVISDIHLNLWPYGDPIQRLDDGLEALRYAFEQLLLEHNVEVLVFTGDLFHTLGSVNTVILSKLDALMAEWMGVRPQTPRIFLPGNHDMGRRTSEHHSLGLLRRYGKVIDYNAGSGERLHEDIPIVGLPYVEEEDTLRRFLDNVREGSLVLLHQGVSGVEIGSKGFVLNEILSPDMISTGTVHCFTGHYHSHKRVSSNLTVPGALMAHHFGDANEPRGFLVAQIDSLGTQITQYETKAPRFLSFEYGPDLPSKISYAASAKDFVRVTGVPSEESSPLRAQLEELELAAPAQMQVETNELVPYSAPDVQDINIGDALESYIAERDMGERRAAVGRSLV